MIRNNCNMDNIKLNEWYAPDNFQELPDTITLYHGTDYDGLTNIIESGVIDAKSGKRSGETKGMNWFFTEYRDNYSRGFMFSIDIDKNEVNKTNNGFKYMNNSTIANYESISIVDHNFKILEAFDLTIDSLNNLWNKCSQQTNNDVYETYCLFVEKLSNFNFVQSQDLYITLDDSITIQLLKQFMGNNVPKELGLIESINNESPDRTIINDITNKWDSEDAIAFVVNADITEAFIGEWMHSDIIYDEIYGDSENDIDTMIKMWGRNNSFHGRLWTKSKIMSFWKQPSPHQLDEIIKLLENKYNLFSENINLYDFKIEISNNEFTPIVDYIKQNETKENNFDMNILHLMNGEEKSKTPQMQTYLKDRRRNYTKKLGKPNNNREVSPAEYNYYKNYNMGESVSLNEIDSSDINLKSFKVKEELHPRIWINDKLNSRVRLRLLDIADDFIDTLAVNWVKPKDIVFTGSLANYNWSKYSDIDLHVIIDYKDVYDKTEFVEDYFNSKKEMWTNEHPKLKIYGFPIEMYVEDYNAESVSSGVYSLYKNKWLKKPINFQDAKLNEKYIKKYAAKIMTQIDNIEKEQKSTNDVHKIEKCNEKLQILFDKIKRIRKESLSKQGEMSSGNIIFKILRRTNYIDKIWNLINSAYDKVNSI